MKFPEIAKEFEGKSILVTGGAGSIGSALVKHILKYNPLVVRVLDTNETGLFELGQECADYEDKTRMLLGDVRDKERILKASQNMDFVFHAAALKHVYLNEYSPLEAVKTNVLGAQNVFDAALENDVGKVIFISTDKAVDPTSVMGTTKLLTEKLTTAANYNKGKKRTIFSSVRFGNVLGSRGSIVPIFLEQIKRGGPVTVTDKRMTRFIMPMDRAVELILKASSIALGGEIFILKMPSIRIIDLAELLIEKEAQKYGYNASDIKIKFIGTKPGEKIHESLITGYERDNARIEDELIIVSPSILKYYYRFDSIANNAIRVGGNIKESEHFTSEINFMGKEDIRKILDEAGA